MVSCQRLLFLLQVYYMSKGTLKIANKQYSSTKNDYEMTLNGESSIIPCDDASELPVALCSFVAISDLASHEKDAVLGEDVVCLSVCLSVSQDYFGLY
jgi:replication factor A1